LRSFTDIPDEESSFQYEKSRNLLEEVSPGGCWADIEW